MTVGQNAVVVVDGLESAHIVIWAMVLLVFAVIQTAVDPVVLAVWLELSEMLDWVEIINALFQKNLIPLQELLSKSYLSVTVGLNVVRLKVSLASVTTVAHKDTAVMQTVAGNVLVKCPLFWLSKGSEVNLQ